MKQSHHAELFRNNVAFLFEPESIAAIGSLKSTWFGGQTLISQLRDFGFKGRIYLVNPSQDSVMGMKVYPTVLDIPDVVDLAVIMTASQVVPEVIGRCIAKKVKAAVIVSDGFAEKDEEGIRLQQEVVKSARSAGLCLAGPNTIGTLNTANGLITNPYIVGYRNITPGGIALCSQTGLFGAQAWPFEDMQYQISKMCDLGNKCDVDEVDLLDYLGKDPQTKVIAMHLEDIKHGRAFLEKAKEVVCEKPVLILKPGRAKESAKAIASHTGSLAGEDRIYDVLLRQAGVIRVDTIRELLELPKIFAYQPHLPKGNRVAIVSISGGVGVIGIDAAVDAGLTLAKLSPSTTEKLAQIFPSMGGNPVDLGPPIPVVGNVVSLFSDTVSMVLEDDNVDCLAISTYGGENFTSLEILSDIRSKFSKPLVIWTYGQSLSEVAQITRNLDNIGVPVYSEWQTAIKALGVAWQYAQIKSEFLLNRG